MDIFTKFKADIRSFMREHKMSKTTFGVLSTKNRNAVFDWFKGVKPNLDTVDRVYKFMDRYEP